MSKRLTHILCDINVPSRRGSAQSLAVSGPTSGGIEGSLHPKGCEHPRLAIRMCSSLHGGDHHYPLQVYLSKEWPESSLYTKPKPLSTVCEKGDLCCFTAGLGPSASGLGRLLWPVRAAPRWAAQTAMSPIALSVAISRVMRTNGNKLCPKLSPLCCFANYE